ncbi:glycosyltransferase [Clostridium neonatale]|uniref:Glycosyltransferase n=1 Tax=Clostridium neonatale TaxID=137838 RepID=A0A2A7MM50_9CLOT|nr:MULTISPECIES: glycosyltransferase [Clostridium]MDU4847375.1 glycosyltransferase [Clostridium sp.]PEG28446.1 glycosyltransferase [Clostridium neonatale]PEG32593.1 glycosyltransferase [Clostridium neonatale]CAH0438853.1 Putative glycosyltransferase [Clostridium neonatale]
MGRVRLLTEKSIRTLKEDGVGTLIKKSINYIEKCRNVEKGTATNKHYLDVLFINGCFLPHPSRYRVSHQREQLMAAGILSDEIFYEDLSSDLVRNYRVFIFFRCPITDDVMKLIKKAKEHNKTVIFDIDDLVIDKKYTDTIEYLNTLSKEEKANYDTGVNRMRETLRMCDSAITTTERLAEELKNYVPEVYINRNVASNRMVELSNKALYDRDILPYKDIKFAETKKEKKKILQAKKMLKNTDIIKIGYFSGSITHNDDINMILPVITKIMTKYSNVEFHIVGELDIPKELESFKHRIIANPFVDWKKLPELISKVDINIAPLVDTIFNEAKSENKWVEASLVKVVTVASNVGAMKKMISNNETGFLCSSNDEWYDTLEKLILNNTYRKEIAENAYKYVHNNCITTYTAYAFAKYIRSKMIPNVAFVLPSVQTSGGVLVVLKHCLILKEAGYDVLILNEGFENKNLEFEGKEILCFSKHEVEIHGSFDKCIATLWATTDFLLLYPHIKEKYYLVQNFETDFYKDGQYFKLKANATYCDDHDIKFITISKWCEKWLKEKYEKECKFAPNGLNITRFNFVKRDFNKDKIRILVEGNSDDYYKNVDESFKIVDKLDKNKFEIWYMSYQGKPKEFYYVDKFLHRVPYDKVPEVYQKCDVLIKSSILESFSYPPLEMMATGGICVVAPNEGNIEYLTDRENCLMYDQGNIDMAVKLINEVCTDNELREQLIKNGLKTSLCREWDNIKKSVINLYI